MSQPQGATPQISELIKIPDSGTDNHIIRTRRGPGEVTEQSDIRIEPRFAEPLQPMKPSQTPSKKQSQSVAAAPTPEAKLTGPQRAFLASGLKETHVARRLIGWSRPTPKQVQGAVRYMREVLRRGNAGEDYARRLAALIGCRADLLMLPRACWPYDDLPYRGAAERGAEGMAATMPSLKAVGAGSSRSQIVRPRPTHLTKI